MFRRVLIANRGEVAARVMRTCGRLGIDTVQVATDADASLSFLQQATIIENIGGPRAYLDADVLIRTARKHRCSAVHPGWGFLSESPAFAARCEAAGLTFIGPRSGTMRRMADKVAARKTMDQLGVPTVPGSHDVLADVAEAEGRASSIGFPVLLKAVSGGGGRGLRVVRSAKDLASAFDEASAEAVGAFGDGRLYLERFIRGARHIEFQVVGDGRDVQVLGERECSIQRRHQKLLEETPSPGLQSKKGRALAERTAEQVKTACVAFGYRGAGTVEMLLTEDGDLFFMEMNTRLQVEHTVTEMVTGVDLVEAQLRVAANHRLSLPSPMSGHAIQCRINAEDPDDGFRPTPGTLTRLDLPSGEGIRVDTHLVQGDSISPHYDSMIAKVIAHGSDRTEAIERMDAALSQMVVEGVPTTLALHREILAHEAFRSGEADTGFVERELRGLKA